MKIYKKIIRNRPKMGEKTKFAIVPTDSTEELKKLFKPTLEYDNETILIKGVYIDNLIEAVSFIMEDNPDLMMRYLKSKGSYQLNE